MSASIPASASPSMTPMCDQPRAEPLPSASPMRGVASGHLRNSPAKNLHPLPWPAPPHDDGDAYGGGDHDQRRQRGVLDPRDGGDARAGLQWLVGRISALPN